MSEKGAITSYDRAKAALQKAVAVDEVKNVRDAAVAMRAYATQSKDKTLKLDAQELIERATRRLGEMIAAQKALPRSQGGGLAKGTRGQIAGGSRGHAVITGGSKTDPPVTSTPTLADLGIDKHLASDARRLARIDEATFEERLAILREREEEKRNRLFVLGLTREDEAAEPPAAVVTPGFPDGPFRTIVLDPPWPIEKIVLERRPVEREVMDYATMSLEEIKALPVGRLADSRGAHIYLWVTHKFLPFGLECFEEWGVRYECILTWFKPTAQPLWWTYNTEHVLFGKVASLAPMTKGTPVGFKAPQQRHSHKPKEFFDTVRIVSPEPRLTMFDGDREGFVSWGIGHTTPTP